MPPDPPIITMTSFGGFVTTDPPGQLSKVRDIKRRYESDYSRGSDYWQRFIEDLQALHRRRADRAGVDGVGLGAPAVRIQNYESAREGYRRFWGRKEIELLACPAPVLWEYDRLRVRVNPEWLLRINGVRTLVKLHTNRKVTLDQRMANPLLFLLEVSFPDEEHVMLLDVHRGKPFERQTAGNLEPLLRMQAAAFLAGWDALFHDGIEAA